MKFRSPLLVLAILLSAAPAYAGGSTAPGIPYVAPGATNNVLTSNGTQWISGTPVSSGTIGSCGAGLIPFYSSSGTVLSCLTPGTGLSISGTTFLAQWGGGSVSSLATGLSIVSGALTPQWQAGAVTALGSGLSLSAGTLSAAGGGVTWPSQYDLVISSGSGNPSGLSLGANQFPLGQSGAAPVAGSLGSSLCVVSATVNTCTVDTTHNSSSAVANVGGQDNFSTASSTITVPGTGTIGNGQTALVTNQANGSQTLTNSQTVNGLPLPTTLHAYGFYGYTGNGSSLDAFGFPGFGTITANALQKFIDGTGAATASTITDAGSGVTIGSPTGGAQGAGTLNVAGTIYENGVAVGTGGGNVSTTGSPASGNLTKFSGSTSITNGDLSGDCTTSGTLVTTCPIKAVPTASGSGSQTLTGNANLYVCSAACTITLPTPAAGIEACVRNAPGVSTAITLAAMGGSAQYEKTDNSGYGTAGTGTLTSGGAVGDKVCVHGLDSTHYLIGSYNGTWTAS